MAESKNTERKGTKKKSNFPKYNYDLLLKEMGSLGKYQIILLVLSYYIPVPSGMNQVASIFVSAVPEYRCRIPEFENMNLTESDLVAMSVPKDSNGNYDWCKRYLTKPNCSEPDAKDCFLENTTYCVDGYEYDRTSHNSTTATEWDLVCDRLILGTFTLLMYFFGVAVGSPIGGNLSDRFGRTRVALASQLIIAAIGIACSYSPSVWIFALTRFIIACCNITAWECIFVFMIEIVPNKWRTPVGIFIQAAFAVGYISLSGMSYVWRDWRSLQFAIAMFSLVFPFIWFFMPESPRWLLSMGHIKKGKAETEKIAQRNGHPLSEDVWDRALITDEDNTTKQYLPYELFKRPLMRVITLKMMFIWFVVAMVYYGLSLNVVSLAGDERINNVLSGICEVLACPVAVLTIDRFGRRPVIAGMFFMSGLACIFSTAVNYFSDSVPALGIVGTVFAMIGKLGVSAAFAIIYNYTAELFPTVVRGTAIGTGSMSARIGTLFSPLIILVQHSIPWLTGVVFGVLALLAGGMCLFLPETKSASLTATLDDAEKFYAHARNGMESDKTQNGTELTPKLNEDQGESLLA